MITYNRKEHELWLKKAKTDPACVLVLARFDSEKRAFLNDFQKFVS